MLIKTKVFTLKRTLSFGKLVYMVYTFYGLHFFKWLINSFLIAFYPHFMVYTVSRKFRRSADKQSALNASNAFHFSAERGGTL